MIISTPRVIGKNGVIKDFDPKMILSALLRETDVEPKLATKITEETCRFLVGIGKSIQYITTPMIREITNTMLIKNNLELVRLQHTRIGKPRYDLKKHKEKLERIKDKPFSTLEITIENENLYKEIEKELNEVNDLIIKMENI